MSGTMESQVAALLAAVGNDDQGTATKILGEMMGAIQQREELVRLTIAALPIAYDAWKDSDREDDVEETAMVAVFIAHKALFYIDNALSPDEEDKP